MQLQSPDEVSIDLLDDAENDRMRRNCSTGSVVKMDNNANSPTFRVCCGIVSAAIAILVIGGMTYCILVVTSPCFRGCQKICAASCVDSCWQTCAKARWASCPDDGNGVCLSIAADSVGNVLTGMENFEG